MKTLKTNLTSTNYPEDYKEVFKHYLLKKAIIEKYNREESDKIKNKKNEQKYN